eukprot:GFKZ01002602.1.p1 GENE.GFKZ01002602.1~~GFKZ01002602.1.p1  ORF type:complete len:325 (-),score=35.62 GFKZ01002602.1:379-1284(-)
MSTASFFFHISLSTHSFPPSTALLLRALLQTTFALHHLLTNPSARASLSTLTRSTLTLLILRGILGAIAMALWFYALKLLPVGDASTIVYLHPIFAMIIAYFTLAEPITIPHVIAAIVSFSGVYLIAQPANHSVTMDIPPAQRITGSLYALLSALGAAVSFVIVRGLGLRINFMTSILSLGVMYLLVSIAMGGIMDWAELKAQWKGVGWAVVGSVCGVLSQCLTNAGLQHCPAGAGQVVRMVGVAMTYALGIAFLGETPSWASVAGGGLVVMAASVIAWTKTVAALPPRREDVDEGEKQGA